MAINKNFVVKNGFEVSTILILADADARNVGISSLTPRYTLDVAGGIGATHSYISGFSTVFTEFNIGPGGTTLTGVGGSIGIGTVDPAYLLDVRSPVSTGQTALYVKGDLRGTGTIYASDITSGNANISRLYVANNVDISGSLYAVGISTIETLGVSGLTTTKNLIVTGVSTIATLGVSGLTTTQNLNVTENLNVTGISTIGTLGVSGLTTTQNLNVTGVSTLGRLQVSSGIVTATSGIVTYYGDGQYLQNTITGVGIATAGGTVGLATSIDFRGAGISTVTVSSGIATINIVGGQVGISSGAPAGAKNGDLWYSIDYGRLFVYYNEVTLGIGSTAVWIDAAPFNIGLLEAEDLSIGNLVSNNLNVLGIATATSFVGPLTGNASSATYATSAGISTYATSSGISTYATNAGIATYATSSGISTYATNAGISTVSQGLTGTPNITVGSINASNITGSAATFTNLTVNGTQTIINTISLEISDKNIGIGSTSTPSDALADGSGITIYGTTNKTITWNSNSDDFTFSNGIDIKGAVETVSTGSTYDLGGGRVVLECDARNGTVFTHDLANGIVGITSLKNFPVTKNSVTTFTVLFTQNATGTGNISTSNGIGTNIRLTPFGVSGFTTTSKVATASTITLSATAFDVDIVSFMVHYNGSGTGNVSNYKVYITNNTGFRYGSVGF